MTRSSTARSRRSPRIASRRLHGAPSDAALRIRVVQRADPAVAVTQQGMASAQSAREHVADDVAADIVRVVSSDAEIEERSPSGETTGTHPVGPGDIAVLVRKHSQATLVHDALRRVGVPAVINGAGSVFASDGAKAWQDLLQALERPTSGPRAHAAALTPFLGWSAQRVAEADDETWESVHRRLHGWARVLRTRGVASLLEVITTSERLTERVLERVDGERRMTDLRHVGQLLHRAAVDERLGTTALAGWLRARIRAAVEEGGDEERTRRLESDADAVQVLTIHRSKGLEFPIVYCPFLWDTIWRDDKVADPVVFHDDDGAAQDRRRARGRGVRRARRACGRGGGRRGATPRLRRAHARASPGGHLVGRHARHTHVAAQPPGVRARGGRHRAPALRRAVRRGRGRAVPPAGRSRGRVHRGRAL